MRTIRVFVIRLLIDSDDPQTLRGSIASVLEGVPRPFADAQGLLNLLRQMARSALENQEGEVSETENENDKEEKKWNVNTCSSSV